MENKYTTNYESSRSSSVSEKSGLLYHAKKIAVVGATGLALTLSGCGAMNPPTVNGVSVYKNKTEQVSNDKHEGWVEKHPMATILLGVAGVGLVYGLAHHGGGGSSTSQSVPHTSSPSGSSGYPAGGN